MKIFKLHEPLKFYNAQEDTGVLFHRNFNSILRRDHKKIPMTVAPMSR